MTTLNKPVVVTPAVNAVTSTEFQLVDVQENYGYSTERGMGRGRHNSVTATITFSTQPPVTRNVVVWQDDAYLAVRGTWTDATLLAEIARILEAE